MGMSFVMISTMLTKSAPLQWGIPPQCNDVIEAIMKTGHVMHRPDQLTVNEYQPGQGNVVMEH